MNNRCLH